MRVFWVTAASMIGWIVSAGHWPTSSAPPARHAGSGPGSVACPFPTCRGPALRPVADAAQGAPFCDRGWLALVSSYDVDLIDLHLAFQRCRWDLGRQSVAQLLGHELHIRAGEAQFLSDLPVGEVEAHEVEAQHPDPQRLMMPGQHSAGEIIKATRTGLAPIPLPVRLRVVAAVAHHGGTAATGAAHALRPAMLPHQGEALGIVDQRGKIDQAQYRHGGKRSFEGGELPACFYHPSAFAARPSCLPLSTPDPEKSQPGFYGRARHTTRKAQRFARDFYRQC